ncbi:Serine/threonine protein kinase [Arsukibacterium tuosuense]|uniref:Serine/threonine protein kinase n=1 Tax=Arsukibacterium tuosuense TaxID=1323745 RepID=A0A285JE10_9GAMM|nr:protein kinase [Arsukibacterium tuosuense]SNY58504.1 Serine/threonine protein kinase [Arsukibacterium tuosuense]
MSNNQNKRSNREVLDTHGSSYELGAEMNRGGQGIVYYTQLPRVLVKGFTDKNETKRSLWRKHIAWLIQQNLHELKIARPLALLAEPRAGYVMELMDGLVPVQSLFDEYIDASSPEQKYLEQGGVQRRVDILCQLARTLNQLHSRGLLYGDISPTNVFISEDPQYSETWLIDCDNISLEAHCGLTLHTADYGAPEVVRNEALLSSLTDCWSFAVLAYQLLTHCHPFKGDMVNDGEPELEDAALRGEISWINDLTDNDNVSSYNQLNHLFENSELMALFHRCFEAGRHDPSERPLMSEWLEVLTEVKERLITCLHCNYQTLIPKETLFDDIPDCWMCDTAADHGLVVFEEYIFISESEAKKHPELPDNWLKTGRLVFLQQGNTQELKRMMPSYSYDRWPSDHVKVEYTEKGLGIYPLQGCTLNLQRGIKIKPLEKYQGLKLESRDSSAAPFQLHIGALDQMHVIWQFRW